MSFRQTPHRFPFRRIALIALALVLPGVLSGCIAVAAGAGAGAFLAYELADYESDLPGTPEQVVDAGKRAIHALELNLISATASETEGEVIARTAEDDRVTITVERVAPDTCSVSIRVGLFGDDGASERIFKRMHGILTRKMGLAPAE